MSNDQFDLKNIFKNYEHEIQLNITVYLRAKSMFS